MSLSVIYQSLQIFQCPCPDNTLLLQSVWLVVPKLRFFFFGLSFVGMCNMKRKLLTCLGKVLFKYFIILRIYCHKLQYCASWATLLWEEPL